MPASEAFSPAGISSFFEVCTTDQTGAAITDPARIGARGGGFALARGILAHVSVGRTRRSKISIRINSRPSPEARTTQWALDQLLKDSGLSLAVSVDLKVSVPIAAGYGTSAAGTAASCLAMADAAKIPVTYNELCRLTHIAEVVHRTGLGTAHALFVSGFVLVTEPGAPGIGLVDRLLFPKGHSIVCVYLEPISTRQVLSDVDISSRVNPAALRAMATIRRRPDLPTFLTAARKFSQEAGFRSPDIARVMETMISVGALGVAQNMLGKAVHGVAESSQTSRIVTILRKKFPTAQVFASGLDQKGVRLVLGRKPKH